MQGTISLLKKPLSSKESTRRVNNICKAIVSAVEPKAIILFGSYARGEMTDQSDIDLIVLIDDEKDINSQRKLFRRQPPLGLIPLDIIWMSVSDYNRKKLIGGVAQIASEEGKLIYGDDK